MKEFTNLLKVMYGLSSGLITGNSCAAVLSALVLRARDFGAGSDTFLVLEGVATALFVLVVFVFFFFLSSSLWRLR